MGDDVVDQPVMRNCGLAIAWPTPELKSKRTRIT
jgi:3-deoxy-D-manno-octulosonate 8-phosphate phosphatase KdsC-like HAD superfamily phosphatase